MKICSHCKSVNAQESTVCYFCGAALNVNVNANVDKNPQSQQKRVPAQPTSQTQPKEPKELGFWDAVGKCFDKYASMKGRATRAELWYFILFITIGIMLCSFISRDETMLFLFVLVTLLPTMAVISRRLHDLGRSRFWMFLLLIIIFFGWLALAVICMLPGQEKDNEYGPYEG